MVARKDDRGRDVGVDWARDGCAAHGTDVGGRSQAGSVATGTSAVLADEFGEKAGCHEREVGAIFRKDGDASPSRRRPSSPFALVLKLVTCAWAWRFRICSANQTTRVTAFGTGSVFTSIVMRKDVFCEVLPTTADHRLCSVDVSSDVLILS